MSEKATAFFLSLPNRDRLYLSYTGDPVCARRWLQSQLYIELEFHAYCLGRLGSILPQIFSAQAHKTSLRNYWFDVTQDLLDFIANCKAAEFDGRTKIPARKPIVHSGTAQVHASRLAELPEEFGTMAAVRVLCVSYWQVQKWVRDGLPMRRCGMRRRFSRRDMKSWFQQNDLLAGG